MSARESRLAGNEAAEVLAGALNFSESTALPPLTLGFDPAHEARLSAFAEGWDACLDWLWPQLVRANADADRFWRAAFAPSPKPKFGPSHAERQRATAELQEQRAREWQEARR